MLDGKWLLIFLTAGYHTYLIMRQNFLKFWQRIHETAVIHHKSFCRADHQRIMENTVGCIQQTFQSTL